LLSKIPFGLQALYDFSIRFFRAQLEHTEHKEDASLLLLVFSNLCDDYRDGKQ
jgi:hypothetical protein